MSQPYYDTNSFSSIKSVQRLPCSHTSWQNRNSSEVPLLLRLLRDTLSCLLWFFVLFHLITIHFITSKQSQSTGQIFLWWLHLQQNFLITKKYTKVLLSVWRQCPNDLGIPFHHTDQGSLMGWDHICCCSPTNTICSAPFQYRFPLIPWPWVVLQSSSSWIAIAQLRDLTSRNCVSENCT